MSYVIGKDFSFMTWNHIYKTDPDQCQEVRDQKCDDPHKKKNSSW